MLYRKIFSLKKNKKNTSTAFWLGSKRKNDFQHEKIIRLVLKLTWQNLFQIGCCSFMELINISSCTHNVDTNFEPMQNEIMKI